MFWMERLRERRHYIRSYRFARRTIADGRVPAARPGRSDVIVVTGEIKGVAQHRSDPPQSGSSRSSATKDLPSLAPSAYLS